MTRTPRGMQPAASAGWWRRGALLTSAVAALTLALVGPVSAAPTAATPTKAKPVTTSYDNPLAPQVPGDGTVDSCADPTVLKGQDGETIDGKQVWYMYCTTDPLNDEDVDANGDPVFHRIPMIVSTDLVNWTYVGDAFPLDGGDLPAWIDPTAAFWAPEVVYSSATDQYYLFVTVTETTAAGGGSRHLPAATAPSASRSATARPGPWTFTDEPVVQPRLDPDGADRAAYFWTFDPDVLGDTVTDEGILYYGSYYGGMFATDVTFTETGVTAATRDDGRRHPDRHRQPLRGRQRRRQGRLLLPLRLGHELLQRRPHRLQRLRRPLDQPVRPVRGPRGQLLPRRQRRRHAVPHDERQPLGRHRPQHRLRRRGRPVVDRLPRRRPGRTPSSTSTPGFTKRPALLDPVDWVNGWPTGERRGRGLRHARCRHRPRRRASAAATRPSSSSRRSSGRLLDPDEFSRHAPSTATGRGREGREGDATVSGGPLRWEVEHTDLYVDTNTASVLVRDAPSGDYVVETKVRLPGPARRGLLLQLRPGRTGALRRRRQLHQADLRLDLGDAADGVRQGAQPGARGAGAATATPSSVRPADDWTYLRIVVEHLHGAEQARGRRRHRALHRVHQPGRQDAGCGAACGRTAWATTQIGLVVDGRHRPGDGPHHRRVRLRAGLLPEGRCTAEALTLLPPTACAR